LDVDKRLLGALSEEEGGQVGKIREFMTNRGPLQHWSDRDEDDLIASSKGGHLCIPCFRPFDFLAEPNKLLPFLVSASSRLSVDAPRGTEQQFHRNVDFDTLYFQFAGETSYEAEPGRFVARPGELMLMPNGVAHCATGSADSLRLVIHLRDQVEALFTPEKHIGETRYDVRWIGGVDWPVPAPVQKNPDVFESMHTWDDRPGDETLIKRRRERLVGVMTGGREIQKIRLFDIFSEITGGKSQGPLSMRNDRFLVECYNTNGEQFAFHRGNRNEELQFNFAGGCKNISEFGTDDMESGDLVVVRRGIAHRVIGSRDFRRITLYGADPWQVMIDPTKPLRKSRFEVTETVVDPAPWRKELTPA
jgi:hypothetical protein